MLNSRENYDKISSTIDLDFYNESCNEIKYEDIQVGVHHDYSKIVTKAVIETNHDTFYISNNNSLSSSTSTESICSVSNKTDEFMVNTIENNDSLSDNDISDISNDSYASSSLFTSVSPLTLSESSCTIEVCSDSDSSLQPNEIAYNKLSDDNEKLENVENSIEQIDSSEDVSNEKSSNFETHPKCTNYNEEENEKGSIEGDSCLEDNLKILYTDSILEGTFDSHTSANSSINESTLSKEPNKLQIRKKDFNLTFNREEMIKIERENLILLKKIMAHSKPKTVLLNKPFSHKKTSTAINRAKQQKKIEQDNYILYSKISAIGRMKKIF